MRVTNGKSTILALVVELGVKAGLRDILDIESDLAAVPAAVGVDLKETKTKFDALAREHRGWSPSPLREIPNKFCLHILQQ